MSEIEEALAALREFTTQVAIARQEIVECLERGEAPELARAVIGLSSIVQVTDRHISRIEDAYVRGDLEAVAMFLLGVPGDAKMWDYSGGGFEYQSHKRVSESYDRANRAALAAYRRLQEAKAD